MKAGHLRPGGQTVVEEGDESPDSEASDWPVLIFKGAVRDAL